MASTFTPNKSIEQPANGDYPGTWNVPVNADWAIIDLALGGVTNINVTGASGTVVLTTTQYQPKTINFSGVLSANVVYQIPSSVGGEWNVNNTTTGAFTLTMSSGGGGLSNVIAQGFITQVYSDGTNIQPTNTSAAIPNNAITNSKLAQMPSLTIKSNITGATANPSDNSLTAILDTISSVQGSILYRDSASWLALAPGASAGLSLQTQGPGANPIYAPNPPVVDVRQTVLSGPLSAGLPSFLPATSGTLSITSQNISTGSAQLVVASANGFSSIGQVDTIGFSTVNLTWPSLTASITNYLYVTVSGGALTPGSTTLQPIYQYGGTISTANGQYTFDIAQMKMFLGNGSVANQASVVFLGEAVASGGAVTSTVAYAYLGYYDSGLTNTLPGTATSIVKNANIGVTPQNVRVIAQCLTAEGNYSIGDQISNISSQFSGANASALTIGETRNTIFFTTGASTAMFWLNKTTGGALTPTAANWAYKMIASRGW